MLIAINYLLCSPERGILPYISEWKQVSKGGWYITKLSMGQHLTPPKPVERTSIHRWALLYTDLLSYEFYCLEVPSCVVMETFGSFVLACLANLYSGNLWDVHKSREKSLTNKDAQEPAAKQQVVC